jgi:hypothetical protein
VSNPPFEVPQLVGPHQQEQMDAQSLCPKCVSGVATQLNHCTWCGATFRSPTVFAVHSRLGCEEKIRIATYWIDRMRPFEDFQREVLEDAKTNTRCNFCQTKFPDVSSLGRHLDEHL